MIVTSLLLLSSKCSISKMLMFLGTVDEPRSLRTYDYDTPEKYSLTLQFILQTHKIVL